jgi:hypothetical protein
VVAVTAALQTQSAATVHAVVLNSSTNLVNLRERPVWVLVVSAFVVPTLQGLWLVPFLALAVGAAQRWLGRTPTVFVGVVGHVGATLVVAVLLVSGITNGRLAASVADDPDVGVSYVLVCLAGLLAVRVPAPWRRWYAAALAFLVSAPLAVHPTFTDLGHVLALATGFGFAVLAARAAQHRVSGRRSSAAG